MSGDWPDQPPRDNRSPADVPVPEHDAIVTSDTAVASAATPTAGQEAPRSRFGAARAIGILLLTFLAQIVAGIVVIVVGLALAARRGESITSPDAMSNVLAQSTVAVLLLSAVFSLLALLLGTRLLARDVVRDRTAAGIGRLSLTKREALVWLTVGVLLSLAYGAICSWIVPPDPSTPLGPLAKAAAAGGASRIAWILLALIFAPLIEELLFRGILLRGFSESWGRVPAGVAVTVLFVAMHLFETASYWPATVAVTAMAVVALMARLRTGSLAAAAAVHFAYNGTIVLMALLSS